METVHIRPTPPLHMLIITYLNLAIFTFFGYLNDFLIYIHVFESFGHKETNREAYIKLYSSFATFYIRNIIRRMWNMWNHPICSTPGSTIQILERKFNTHNIESKLTGNKFNAINLGSYNYLGYAQNEGPITDSVEQMIKDLGVGLASPPNELGKQTFHLELDKLMSKFLGVEDCIVVGMGFATNSTSIPALLGRGCLVVSDEHNHASLILGCRLSGTKVKVFKHNDMNDLESIIRESIIKGQPKSGRAWRKICIMVEGIYSMEGTIVNLPEVIRIKTKYKTYLYLDEAHSIGALGCRGRGVCDYYNCDPKSVDILMGTFTKSFAAAGGYIGGKKHIIDYIRSKSAAFIYATAVSPPIAQQIISVISGMIDANIDSDAMTRIAKLRQNTNYFRQQLINSGFHIDGNNDSPVIPLMIYSPTILKCFILELMNRGIATTGASFPVTSIVGVKARLCLSASHTPQMIEYILKSIDEVGDMLCIKYSKQ